MIDLRDKNTPPTLEEIGAYVQNPVFTVFCSAIKTAYQCGETIEFSSCSWEPGWNLKFKKSGKTLCTLYAKEGYFRALTVVGRREKEFVEAILPECTAELQTLYRQTPEGNGQRWLIMEITEQNELYRDLLRLIQIRKRPSI